MSSTECRNHIFVDRGTRRVLAVRRTMDLDLSFELEGVVTYRITAPDPIFLNDPLTYRYSPAEGFVKERVVLIQDERRRLDLLQRKIDILQQVQTRVLLAEKELEGMFGPGYVDGLSSDDRSFRIIHGFMEREKEILRSRSRTFFQEFLAAIEAVSDLESLEREYENLMYNSYIMSMGDWRRDRSHV